MPIYRVSAKGTVNDQEWRNVFHMSSTLDIGDLQEDMDDLHDTYVTHLKPAWSSQCTLYGYDVRAVEQLGSPTVPYVPTVGPLVGDQPFPTGATQVCMLVSFALVALPPNRGRKYLPGFLGADIEIDGRWSAARLAEAQAWGEAILDIGTGDPNLLFPLAVQYDESGVVTVWNELDIAIAKDNPATQRRRRLGVGS